MANPAVPAIAWRLRVLMAERDIRTTRCLRRRLAEYGVKLSEPQLGRIVKTLPCTLNTRLLAALCAVLDASPGDLLLIPGRAAPTTSLAPVSVVGAEPVPSATPSLPPAPMTASGRPRATVIPRPKY